MDMGQLLNVQFITRDVAITFEPLNLLTCDKWNLSLEDMSCSNSPRDNLSDDLSDNVNLLPQQLVTPFNIEPLIVRDPFSEELPLSKRHCEQHERV